ncbi:MAG: gamma-glutamyl-gamma-aminobutyrate hydrolase family protein [Bacteroidales bacterium]
MKRSGIFRLIFLLSLLLSMSCGQESERLKIAVSKISGDYNQNHYIRWLRQANPEADYIVMYDLPKDSVEIIFRECSGLLLTGGKDVYPGRYGQEADTARCGAFDLYRDSLEFGLIEMALERKMPVMGICRGQQILNVALGGTLYVDIPSDLNTAVLHRCEDWENCYHRVRLIPGGLLQQISGIREGVVNTNHHQAVDRLAGQLRVLATGEDGVIESVGWHDTLNNGWLLGVQWHPERLDSFPELSGPLAGRFVREAEKYMHSN